MSRFKHQTARPTEPGSKRPSLREQLERAAPRLEGDTVARMRGDIDHDEYARRVKRTRAENNRRP